MPQNGNDQNPYALIRQQLGDILSPRLFGDEEEQLPFFMPNGQVITQELVKIRDQVAREVAKCSNGSLLASLAAPIRNFKLNQMRKSLQIGTALMRETQAQFEICANAQNTGLEAYTKRAKMMAELAQIRNTLEAQRLENAERLLSLQARLVGFELRHEHKKPKENKNSEEKLLGFLQELPAWRQKLMDAGLPQEQTDEILSQIKSARLSRYATEPEEAQ